ncbi:unnamed protein product [Camellia sinensis]
MSLSFPFQGLCFPHPLALISLSLSLSIYIYIHIYVYKQLQVLVVVVMAVTMHVKSDSEVTSIDASSPPRSPRRPMYYVQSPSQHDVEKMSYGSSPFASPHHYHCSPIHHSRESSTSRFSASLKNPAAWKRLQRRHHDGDEDDGGGSDDDDDEGDGGQVMRFYVVCFVLSFVALFTIFSLILLAASSPYKPKIFVKSMVFQNFDIQAGMDQTGVPTDMLTLNSTVRIFYRNPATFFGVHVTSTPLELHYYQLKLATGYLVLIRLQRLQHTDVVLRLEGQMRPTWLAFMWGQVWAVASCATMKKFYQSRKSQRMVMTLVLGHQVPLYGGIPLLSGAISHLESVSVPLNLTFVMRSRAYILGRLVKPKFYRSIICGVVLQGNRLGKHLNLTNSCIYND